MLSNLLIHEVLTADAKKFQLTLKRKKSESFCRRTPVYPAFCQSHACWGKYAFNVIDTKLTTNTFGEQ